MHRCKGWIHSIDSSCIDATWPRPYGSSRYGRPDASEHAGFARLVAERRSSQLHRCKLIPKRRHQRKPNQTVAPRAGRGDARSARVRGIDAPLRDGLLNANRLAGDHTSRRSRTDGGGRTRKCTCARPGPHMCRRPFPHEGPAVPLRHPEATQSPACIDASVTRRGLVKA